VVLYHLLHNCQVLFIQTLALAAHNNIKNHFEDQKKELATINIVPLAFIPPVRTPEPLAVAGATAGPSSASLSAAAAVASKAPVSKPSISTSKKASPRVERIPKNKREDTDEPRSKKPRY
jgi:hypothetical protein